jgi:hypothetical protein
MARKIIQYSFAGGEVTPELVGRVDLPKRQTGLELCQNMLVLAHGPVTRRPGARIVAQMPGTAFHSALRLIPFILPDGSGCMLVASPTTTYVMYRGSPVLLPAKNVTAASFGSSTTFTSPSHGLPNGALVRISAPTGYPRLVSRDAVVRNVTTNTFEVRDITTDAPINTAGYAAYGGSGITVRQFYEIPIGLLPADGNMSYAQDGDRLFVCSASYGMIRLTYSGLTSWAVATMSFSIPTNAPTGVSVQVINTQGTQHGRTDKYVVTTVAQDGITESVPSAEVTAGINRLDLAGSINRITWNAVPDAFRYYVYKFHGGVYAYIGQASGTTFDDVNIVPDVQKTPPMLTNPVNTGPGDYPATAAFYEQRMWVAGMANKSQSVIATRIGTTSNVSSSLPTQDDDSFEFRLASLTRGAIRHLVPLADLLALTSEGAWRLYSDADEGIGPSTLRTKVQTFYGAAYTRPVVVGNAALYIRKDSARLLELRYAWENNSFVATDISLLAPHLFNFHTFRDMSVALDGEVFVWMARDDGTLLCVTYVPDQDVYAWHRHVLADGGKAESVCAINEGDAGIGVYVSVLRGTRRTLERIGTRNFPSQADHYYVDCGYTYDGAPADVLYGLHALEGKTVTVIADGGRLPPAAVTNGMLQLPTAARKVHVGMDPQARVKTLPLIDNAPAQFQGTAKNVSRAMLRLTDTNAVRVGDSFETMVSPPMRPVDTPLGTPAPLQTTEVELFISAQWGNDGAVHIEAAPGAALTVTSLVVEVEEGG